MLTETKIRIEVTPINKKKKPALLMLPTPREWGRKKSPSINFQLYRTFYEEQ
jgi:hypothetical protein